MSGTRGSGISPAALILTASVVSGAAGYLVSWLVASSTGVVAYSAFAVYWSALFIVVGALGGIQQEVTRATTTGPPAPKPARLALLAPLGAVALFVVLGGTSMLWVPRLFPAVDASGLGWPLAVGVASYLVVAVICGALYGLRAWWGLVAMIVVDGVLRLSGIVVVLVLGGGLVELAWAVALPFPLAVLVVLPFIQRHLRATVVDVGVRQLGWNIARTIVATAATATLVSGFPLLLRATSPHAPAAVMGALLLALTLTRAPIVIPLMSLQSYLVVYFGERLDALRATALRLVGLVLVASAALAALAALAGPWLLVTVFGAEFSVGPALVFVLVASSGLIAGMCVSGPAVLARGQHGVFIAGWVVAAISTILVLLMHGDLETRVRLALLFGPLAGLVTHCIALARSIR